MIKAKESKPVWLKLTEEKLKKLITQIAEKHSPAQLGLVLRDQYGIPTTKVYGKKLGKYLKELGFNKDFDKENNERKIDRLQEHCKNNITDKKAKHKLQKVQGRTNTLKKYAQRRNKD